MEQEDKTKIYEVLILIFRHFHLVYLGRNVIRGSNNRPQGSSFRRPPRLPTASPLGRPGGTTVFLHCWSSLRRLRSLVWRCDTLL